MLLPLTFPAYASIQDASGPPINVIESDFNSEQTASFVSWRTENGLHHTAVGSSKGSINVFSFYPTNAPNSDSRARLTVTLPSEHNPPTAPSSSPSHSRRHSRSLQSPSSLSFNQALINVSARARVVSGVSHEQVEAPKNYVDFEDEPERLKDILRSNSKHKRTLADSILPSFDRGVVIEQSPGPASPTLLPILPNSPSGAASTSKNKDDPRSLLSATNSPTFPLGPLSAPSSPRQLSPHFDGSPSRGTVKASIILDSCGPGHAASAMRYIETVDLLVVLQESGNLSVFDMRDNTCVATCACTTTRSYQDRFWKWEAIRMVSTGDKTYHILTCASPSQPPFAETFGLADEPRDSKARLNMFELSVGDPHGVHPTRFERLASDVWQVDAPAAGVELLVDTDGSFQLAYINSTNYLVARCLTIIPAYEIRARGRSLTSSPTHSHEDHRSLAIPNPFKAFGSKSVESVALLGQNHNSGTEQESISPTITASDLGRVLLEEEESLGIVISSSEVLLEGITARYAGFNERIIGLAWSNTDITGFTAGEQDGSLTTFPVPFRSRGRIQGVHFMDDEAFVVLSDNISYYCLRRVDADNNTATTFSGTSIIAQAIQTTTTSGGLSSMLSWSRSSPHDVLVLRQLRSGQKEILVHTINPRQDVPTKQQRRILWRAQSPSSGAIQGGATLMSVLPVELNFVLLGYSDGHIRQTSLPCLLQRSYHAQSTPLSAFSPVSGSDVLFDKISDMSLPSSILTMHLVRNDRTGERYILGGTDDGGIAIWALESLKLQARFTPFIVPLTRVAQVLQSNENAGPLRGSLLCVSSDGTIAVVSIEGFEMLYLIPGASSPIARIYAGGDDNNRAILIYADGSARVWDVESGEFLRATTEEKVKELVGAGGWINISLGKSELTSISISMLSGSAGPVSSCTLLLSLDRFLKYTSVNVKSSGLALSSSAPSKATLSQLRAVLSVLLTPGLSSDIDEICENGLGTSPSPSTVGFASAHATTIYHHDHPVHAWSMSAKVSADRVLAIVSVLRTLSLAEELSHDCQTVITFYSTSLAHVVGASYQAPDVTYLATQWFDSSNDVRQAAKTLFDAGIVRLSDEESIALVDAWQHHLPCLQPSMEKESAKSSLALFICGYMAAEKYSLLSTSSLIDISKSIALYLHDESSAHRGLAIDLCARGFQIWQHYIDAMAMLRALYTLATNSRKETISAQNTGPQARLAVLQIASSNTPLFMTTLTLDILNPKTLDQRKAVMQLVAFMIRKRPLILYPNLPKLMEAVVKSLDPNSTASRDAVLDSATEIIGHVVKTFPTVDFHMATQRLAVGTSEGAFIMYDLKTATQLYVLEGHKRRPTACMFSPDGRRLVTMSLEEGVVLVWKVGSSFTSFFNPGAPPRQGHGGSLPFKTLNFNVGDEANMTIAGTLEWVKFEWPAERTVRLHIRESVLTFST